jgi:hypothetical protein
MESIENAKEHDRQVFKNTCGKRVKITYTPYQYIDEISSLSIFKSTIGTIDNMTCEHIYIINDDDCIEMFRIKQILEMIQILK